MKKVSSHTLEAGFWYLLGMKNISSCAHKIASWYLLGDLFKIFDKHPCPFLWELSLGVRASGLLEVLFHMLAETSELLEIHVTSVFAGY